MEFLDHRQQQLRMPARRDHMTLETAFIYQKRDRARVAGGFDGEQFHGWAKKPTTSSMSRHTGIGGKLPINTRP